MSACLYCGQEILERPRSREHIVPACIGGCGPLVTRQVCDSCNEFMSGNVDISFCRDWFISSVRLTAGVENRGKPPVHLHGSLNWDRPEEVLVFMTRDGATIHRISGTPDGRPRIIMQLDPDDSGQVEATLRVLRERFPGIPVINSLGDRSEYERDLLDAMIAAGPAYSLTMEIDLRAWDRQVVKMGLGLAAQTLGDGFIGSESARRLRSFVFEPSSEVRSSMELRGSVGIGSLSAPQITRYLRPGGDEHLLALMSVGGRTVFVANLFGQFENSVVVSDSAEYNALLPGELVRGLAWVVDGVAKTVRGPIAVETLMVEAGERADGGDD